MTFSEKKYIRLRLILIGIVFTMLFGAIGTKAAYLQIFRTSWLSSKAADQYTWDLVKQGRRGTIYDANHIEMAVSIDTTSVAAYPRMISDPDRTAGVLAKALDLNKRNVKRKLISKRSFVWLKRQVTPRETNAVSALEITGIDFIPAYGRFYPNRGLAASVLGFSGTEGRGLEGLEYRYENYLQGPTRKVTVLKDALGRGFNEEKEDHDSEGGNNLVLTIDRNIQYIAENALQEAVTRFSARSGMAIVMAPKTGAILALAQNPNFNPNAFGSYDKELWRNRAITDPFEPGSTMKIFSAAAAIESGICTPNTIFFCENGSFKVGKHTVHDTHPHDWLSLQQIVKYSSNIGAVKVGQSIDQEFLYTVLRNFGFGQKTGIDCPGETSGSLASWKRWSSIDAGAIAFGQGMSVSAVQLAAAVSAIANDGILMKPYVVQAITDTNGRLIKNTTPQKIRQVVSSETARTVRRILRTVTTSGGTGVQAALEGYTVCGKTGTAQKVDRSGGYAKGKYVASFVGFVPARAPKLTILVVIDEPEKQHYGGIVAAPVFRTIAEESLNYLNIPSRKPETPLRAAQTGKVMG
ncbi:MAG: cell division protein FtsI [Desulfobacteraceae bacterium 4572_123]|nr:MAG: cell division protein FtsI [Desulfobacteraceae bacterium 4572_123]